jgi:hypothetical protein
MTGLHFIVFSYLDLIFIDFLYAVKSEVCWTNCSIILADSMPVERLTNSYIYLARVQHWVN